MAIDVGAAGELTTNADILTTRRTEDRMRIATDSESIPHEDDKVRVDIEGVEGPADESDVDESDVDESDVDDDAEAAADDARDVPAPRSRKPLSAPWRAMSFGLAAVVMLAALVGWLGFRAHQSHQAHVQRSQFLQAARQGALNLTTIDWQHADTDVQRILDGATGQFYDDFAKRSQPFVDAVRHVKASTVGTVTEAGLDTETGGIAQVLVALAVKTSSADAPDQPPRAWRMRIFVQKVGNQVKVSNVEFVP
jgi:Mce-associated membrane protein